jgi:hypothetical protein
LAAFGDGSVKGQLAYAGSGWSGQFQFSGATILAPGVALPLKHAQGNVVFTPTNLDVAHFNATFADHDLQGSYHYNQSAKRPERLHVELAAATFDQLTAALEPAWREPGLLARLPFTKRSIAPWLAARNLEGDIAIASFVVNQGNPGPFSTRFIWQGVNLQLSALQLALPEGSLKGTATVNFAGRVPASKFQGKLVGYHWGGGVVDTEGIAESSGVGLDALRSLHASGTFAASDVSLSLNEDFAKLSGGFEVSFTSGWPQIHLSKVQAVQPEQEWSGEALSNSDGQLVFDLVNGDRQMHIVSILTPPPPTSPAAVAQK